MLAKTKSIWPYVAIPFASIYVLDMLGDLLAIAQLVAMLIFGAYVTGFMAGAMIVLLNLRSDDTPKKLPNVRFFRYLPTIGYGVALTEWLLEEPEPAKKNK